MLSMSSPHVLPPDAGADENSCVLVVGGSSIHTGSKGARRAPLLPMNTLPQQLQAQPPSLLGAPPAASSESNRVEHESAPPPKGSNMDGKRKAPPTNPSATASAAAASSSTPARTKLRRVVADAPNTQRGVTLTLKLQDKLTAAELKSVRQDFGLSVGGNKRHGAALVVGALNQHERHVDPEAALESLMKRPKPSAAEKTEEKRRASAIAGDAEEIEETIAASTPLERVRDGGSLPASDLLDLLHAAASGELTPRVAGGAAPRTDKRHGLSDDGVSPATQYVARLLAWDSGRPQAAEPPSQVPATQLPDAMPTIRITHLSDAERQQRKDVFLAKARDDATSGPSLSSRPRLEALLRRSAANAVDWLAEKMPPSYAAELMHVDENGRGRERVRELMSPIHFLRDYVRDDDVQFFGELGLSQDKSDILLSIIVSKLMLKTFATNIFVPRPLVR